MKTKIAAALSMAAMLGLAVAVPAGESAAREDRCADARRTCIAWCEEFRGPDGTCQADCWRRYKKCKRTGWFIWGQLAPDTRQPRYRPTMRRPGLDVGPRATGENLACSRGPRINSGT